MIVAWPRSTFVQFVEAFHPPERPEHDGVLPGWWVRRIEKGPLKWLEQRPVEPVQSVLAVAYTIRVLDAVAGDPQELSVVVYLNLWLLAIAGKSSHSYDVPVARWQHATGNEV